MVRSCPDNNDSFSLFISDCKVGLVLPFAVRSVMFAESADRYEQFSFGYAWLLCSIREECCEFQAGFAVQYYIIDV